MREAYAYLLSLDSRKISISREIVMVLNGAMKHEELTLMPVDGVINYDSNDSELPVFAFSKFIDIEDELDDDERYDDDEFGEEDEEDDDWGDDDKYDKDEDDDYKDDDDDEFKDDDEDEWGDED